MLHVTFVPSVSIPWMKAVQLAVATRMVLSPHNAIALVNARVRRATLVPNVTHVLSDTLPVRMKVAWIANVTRLDLLICNVTKMANALVKSGILDTSVIFVLKGMKKTKLKSVYKTQLLHCSVDTHIHSFF